MSEHKFRCALGERARKIDEHTLEIFPVERRVKGYLEGSKEQRRVQIAEQFDKLGGVL